MLEWREIIRSDDRMRAARIDGNVAALSSCTLRLRHDHMAPQIALDIETGHAGPRRGALPPRARWPGWTDVFVTAGGTLLPLARSNTFIPLGK